MTINTKINQLASVETYLLLLYNFAVYNCVQPRAI